MKTYALIQRGDKWVRPPPPPPPPLENHKNKGFLSNIGPGPLENHKATKPAFNVGPIICPPAKRNLNGVRWSAYDGPLLALVGPGYHINNKTKNVRCWTPSYKISWICARNICSGCSKETPQWKGSFESTQNKS